MKDSSKTLWETVRQEEDLKKAIRITADAAEEILNENKMAQDLIKAEIQKINRILCGNGNPSNSIIARLEDIEKYVSTFSKILTSLVILVLGEMVLKVLGLF